MPGGTTVSTMFGYDKLNRLRAAMEDGGSDPQTLNLYGYVRNNPLSGADPDGHCCEEAAEFGEQIFSAPTPAAKILGGAIIGVAALGTALTNPSVRNAVEDFFSAPAQSQCYSCRTTYDFNRFYSTQRPGTLGKPDHRETVKEEADRVQGRPEVTIKTPGGKKDSRRADAVGKNPDTGAPEIVQVYRPTKGGNIPQREENAAADIQGATRG